MDSLQSIVETLPSQQQEELLKYAQALKKHVEEGSPAPAPFQQEMPQDLLNKLEQEGTSREGERRTVTVVFADISGFTAMSEKLDPEEVQTLMNDCFKVLVEIVYRYEGTIDKFIGDCIMALYGYPIAHENDPELAVRAALEMVSVMEEFNRTLPIKLDKPLSLHIGINTGEVIAGGVGTDQKMDYTVMGDTVNLASRLSDHRKSSLPAGDADAPEIYVSQSTYQSARKAIAFQAWEPIEVKGKADPVPVFQAVRVRDEKVGDDRDAMRADTVGRNDEIAILKNCVHNLTSDSVGQVVSIVGEAGVGKSRLASELRVIVAAAEDVRLVTVQGQSFDQSKSYALILPVIKSLLDISGSDDSATRMERFNKTLNNLAEPGGEADWQETVKAPLANLLSLELEDEVREKINRMDPQQLKRMTFDAVVGLFEKTSARPLIVLFEDLHWADSTSVDLLGEIVALAARCPIVLVCIYRPDAQYLSSHLRPLAEKNSSDNYTEMALNPLYDEEVDLVLASLLKQDKVAPELAEMVRHKADGNPFFIEEIVRALVEQDIVTKEDEGRYALTGSLSDAEIPDSVQGVIQARIDRLPDGPKRVLQYSSVIGMTFEPEVVSQIVGPEWNVEESLDELEKMELCFQSQSFPEVEYKFNNAFVQEVGYNGLLLRRRRQLHSEIAKAIESRNADTDDVSEILARHYQAGLDHAKAAHYLMVSGLKAKAAFANSEAIQFLTDARSELDELSDSEPLPEGLLTAGDQILSGLGDIYDLTGDYEKAIESLTKVAETGSEPETVASGWRRIGRILEKRGDREEAMAYYDRAFEALGDQTESPEAARIFINASWIHNRFAHFDEAAENCQKALKILDNSECLDEIAQAHNNLLVIYENMGRWDDAHIHGARGVEIMEKIGDQRRLGSFCTGLGLLSYKQGDLNGASEQFERALKLMEIVGNTYGQAGALLNLGIVAQAQKNLGDSVKNLELALTMHMELGAEGKVCANLCALAEAYVASGKLDAAEKAAAESMKIAEDNGYAADIAQALKVIGQVKGARGQDAEKEFIRSIEILRKRDRMFELAGTLGTYSAWLAQTGKKDQAEEQQAEATRILTQLRSGV